MLYFNDELDETYNGNNTRTYMMNVDDLDNPVIVGFYESENTAIDHNLYTHNGLLYASNYRSGLRVSTILEDGSIEPQGYFDTYPADDFAEFDGTWSNYPYFPSGSIAVSNFDGLFILRASSIPESIESTDLELPAFGFTPNPASSSLLLSGSFVNCDVVIHDLSGREALRVNSIPAVSRLHLDIHALTDGVYIVTLIDSKSGVINATEKLVVAPH